MASFSDRLKALARSPQGKKLIAQAERQLAKPENQAKLRKLTNRLRGSQRPR